MDYKTIYANAQIISKNPINKEDEKNRICYFYTISSIIRLMGWQKRKYAHAQTAFYKKQLLRDSTSVPKELKIKKRYVFLLPFDIAAFSAFDVDVMKPEEIAAAADHICKIQSLDEGESALIEMCFKAAAGDDEAWNTILKCDAMAWCLKYLQYVRENISFIREKPYNILITATMSAGKSTLINSIVGKNISLARNMACTSKIHVIVSKPFEDGASSEYDSEIHLDAAKDTLLDDNEQNLTSRITVGTFFKGMLGGERIVLLDSPGVNFSENEEHLKISDRMIKSGKYQMLIYVLNSTQLGTTDEEEHLKFVAKNIGRKKILFVMNKADQLISDDEDIFGVIERQKKFLISKGFRSPIICPFSARAAFLAKKSMSEGLSRTEKREFDNYYDKFIQTNLSQYYEKKLLCGEIKKPRNEAERLLKNSGMTYLEKMIKDIKNGGESNVTALR